MDIETGNPGIDARLINLLSTYEWAKQDPTNVEKRENLGRRLAEFNFTLIASLVTEYGNNALHVYTHGVFKDYLKTLILEATSRGNQTQNNPNPQSD